MYRIALKMLIEDKARFLGIVISLAFATIIMSQQTAIFVGLMRRTYGSITDTPQPDIWVMDPSVKMIDDIIGMRDTELYRVRSVKGVLWAVPLFKGLVAATLPDGQMQSCVIIGVDEESFIGAPSTMLMGDIRDLRVADAVVMNIVGAETKMAFKGKQHMAYGAMQVGDTFEINDFRANVVGICDVTRTFQSQPVIYTTYNRALAYAPFQRKELTFVLAKSDGTISPEDLCKRITKNTGLAAYTQHGFKAKTVWYYIQNTGIPISFGLAVLLGLLIGALIAGQFFYNFVMDNLKYLGVFSAMGASRYLLARMTMLQAAFVALLGWGIGSGAVALIGLLSAHTELSFFYAWYILVGSCVIIFLICLASLLISLRKIFTIELGSLFKQ